MERFELSRRGSPDLPHFECGPFNRLGTSPNLCYIPGPDPPTNSAGGNREEQQDRTSNIIQFELGWNPHGSKGFSRLALRIGNLISSQARYDHFDTLPYSHLQASGGEKTGVRLMRGVPPAMRFPRNRHGTIYHTCRKGKCQVFSAKKRAQGRQSCAKVLNESARCFILKNRKPGVLFSGRDARCDRGGITWQRSERNGIGRRSPL